MAYLSVLGSLGSELVATENSPKSCKVGIKRVWSDAIRTWGWANTFPYEQVAGLWTGTGFIDVVESGTKLSKDESALENIKTECKGNKFLPE